MTTKVLKGASFLFSFFIATTYICFFDLQSSYAEEPPIRVQCTLPGAPEGMCVDSHNNLYATMPYRCEVVLIKGDGFYEHVAWVPSREETDQGEIYGIDVDGNGNLYVTYVQKSPYADLHRDLMDPQHPACHDVRVTRSGVYRIDAVTRKVTPVATRNDGWPFCFPDDVAVDTSGNIYMTDLTYSGIWKISPDGTMVDMWSNHPFLNWSDPTLPQGANALVFDGQQKNLYVATTTYDGHIVKIRLTDTGRAGRTVIYSRGHTWFDGIEMDNEGNIYVSEPGANQITIIPAGQYYPKRVTVTSPLFQGPTSLVYREGILYVANLGFGLPKEERIKTIVAVKVKDFLPAQK